MVPLSPGFREGDLETPCNVTDGIPVDRLGWIQANDGDVDLRGLPNRPARIGRAGAIIESGSHSALEERPC